MSQNESEENIMDLSSLDQKCPEGKRDGLLREERNGVLCVEIKTPSTREIDA